jgi:hypothetical protein
MWPASSVSAAASFVRAPNLGEKRIARVVALIAILQYLAVNCKM